MGIQGKNNYPDEGDDTEFSKRTGIDQGGGRGRKLEWRQIHVKYDVPSTLSLQRPHHQYRQTSEMLWVQFQTIAIK